VLQREVTGRRGERPEQKESECENSAHTNLRGGKETEKVGASIVAPRRGRVKWIPLTPAPARRAPSPSPPASARRGCRGCPSRSAPTRTSRLSRRVPAGLPGSPPARAGGP